MIIRKLDTKRQTDVYLIKVTILHPAVHLQILLTLKTTPPGVVVAFIICSDKQEEAADKPAHLCQHIANNKGGLATRHNQNYTFDVQHNQSYFSLLIKGSNDKSSHRNASISTATA